MAREAYRSLYGDLIKLKDDSLLKDPANGTGDDDELFQLLFTVSEWVERWCNRFFYPRTQTLKFDGDGSKRLLVPDLIAVTTLKEDTTDDQTFDETWAATDYWTLPYTATPDQYWGQPYTQLLVREHGSKSQFSRGEQHFEIVGRWGYREFKEDSGTDFNDASLSSTTTTITVDDGTQIAIGHTIQMNQEQMLVVGISTNDLTVTRAINGSPAQAHGDNSVVYILRWPPAIERATLIQTARIWTRAADFEPFFVDDEIDTDVRMLLESYRKPSA